MNFKLLIISFLFCCNVLSAQKNDTINSHKNDSLAAKRAVKKAIYSSARKATILSAILPGAGQIYNRKYWKAPIIYAALGGLGYWAYTNQVQYKFYSNNLLYANDDDETTIPTVNYSNTDLITQKKYYKKYRDLAIIVGVGVYIINIIDANVDAHLKTFDVSDDLSLQIKPYTNIDYNSKLQAGVSLKLRFK